MSRLLRRYKSIFPGSKAACKSQIHSFSLRILHSVIAPYLAVQLMKSVLGFIGRESRCETIQMLNKT